MMIIMRRFGVVTAPKGLDLVEESLIISQSLPLQMTQTKQGNL